LDYLEHHVLKYQVIITTTQISFDFTTNLNRLVMIFYLVTKVVCVQDKEKTQNRQDTNIKNKNFYLFMHFHLQKSS